MASQSLRLWQAILGRTYTLVAASVTLKRVFAGSVIFISCVYEWEQMGLVANAIRQAVGKRCADCRDA